MEKIVILANRLAESILMNWDEEEVIKLAKEVAVACKENIDFTYLVRKMREAQKEGRKWEIVNFKTEEDKVACGNAIMRMYQLEYEVDEYLKKINE